MYDKLSFPLNVYALILQLNDVPVNYLHFGLFKDSKEAVDIAQQRSTETLFSLLPAPPSRILEIGIGLGTTQKLLLDKGYQAEGLTPDTIQIAIAQQRIGKNAQLYCSRFEDYQTDKKYDVIVSQESAQYIDILNLLPKTADLIVENGKLILIDEVSLIRDKPQFTSLHHPEHLKYIAKCCNLSLLEEKDFSQQAKFTMTYLYQGLTLHWENIVSVIDQTETELSHLKKAIENYIEAYETCHYGYRLFYFEKKTQQNHVLKLLSDNDFQPFHQLFQNVFKQNMSLDLWNWKYQDNTAHSLGCWENKQLLGHYGGFEREILFFSQPMRALQVGDTMVENYKRALFTKNGVFHQLARSFLYRFIGYGAPYPIGFGFPNQRVMSLAEKLGLYHKVGQFTRLDWQSTESQASSIRYKIRSFSDIDQAQLEKLWQKMAHACKNYIIGVRNWQRFNYRYLQYPLDQYKVFKISHRLSNQIVAIFVLKLEQQQVHLIDLISQPDDIQLVIRSALRVCQQYHKANLYTLISDNLLPLFNHYHYTQTDPDIAIPHSACTAGARVEDIKNRWWLMAGDSDFI